MAVLAAAQPIEHLASFRAMPNILMLRPGDGTETAGAYKVRRLMSLCLERSAYNTVQGQGLGMPCKLLLCAKLSASQPACRGWTYG